MAHQLTLDQLVAELRHIGDTEVDRLDESTALLQASEAGAEIWRALLRDIPFDRRSFDDRFQPGAWDEVIAELTTWCGRFSDQSPWRHERHRRFFGFLGLFLLTLLGLEESSHRRTRVGSNARTDAVRRRYQRNGSDAGSHDCAALCGGLVRRQAVRDAIREVYRPAAPPGATEREAGPGAGPEDRSSEVWRKEIDFTTLEFHAHGTTSVIVSGEGLESHGRRSDLALKLIIYPFLRIPRIESATKEYKRSYDLSRKKNARHVVRIWASAGSWIVMDLIDGRPLSEDWAERMRGRRKADDGNWLRRQLSQQGRASERAILLEDLKTYGEALFLALAELDEVLNPGAPDHADDGRRRGHCDLTPSNIIVSYSDGKPVFHLIDLGVNYLYTYAFSGLEGVDSRFVAPEVKNEGRPTDKADLYSLGKILILLGGGEGDEDVVPDAFYATAPLLARFIEDLVDESPERRQVVFPLVPGERRYVQLCAVFLAELEAESARSTPTDDHWLHATWRLFQTRLTLGLFRPLAGAPGQLRRIYVARRNKPATQGTSSQRDAALLAWSWLSTVAWAITFSITMTWIVRQSNWEWGNRAVEALQRLVGGSDDRFPVLDDLRASDYVMPDFQQNGPALIVGLTYAMVGAKYYQNLFAQITPMVAGWRAGRLTVSAAVAAFFMRLETIVAGSLVLPSVLVDPRWWPVCSAIGQTLAFLCNATALLFARQAMAQARRRGLTTVPPTDNKVTGMTSFAEWTPSSLFYSTLVWIIGLLILQGALKDVWVYALSVAAINFFLFYLIKCGAGAAEVRIVLTRAMLAAERLRYLESRGHDDGEAGEAGRRKPAGPSVPHHAEAADDRLPSAEPRVSHPTG